MAKHGGSEMEQHGFAAKDYADPPPSPFVDSAEFKLWAFYRALIAEFIATLLFLYITIATVIGHARNQANCGSVGILGIAWSFGGMIFVLVYCTAGISGGHINPAVTFGLFLARKVSLPRAVLYMIAQCLGAICGAGLVKAFQKSYYDRYGGGANAVAHGYTKGVGLAAEIIGTFVLVYTVFSATDPKRNARDSHVPVSRSCCPFKVFEHELNEKKMSHFLLPFLSNPRQGFKPHEKIFENLAWYGGSGSRAGVLAPLPIGFAVFMVHLATIPITGTGINPARSFGAAVIYGHQHAWNDQWIFWVGPFLGAACAAAYHQYVLRAGAIKALGSFRSNPHV
eukprot:Gb_32511 [translate_table: standard]